MKSKPQPFSLSQLLLAVLAVSAFPSLAQSVSVNFGADRGPSPVSEASKTTGAILVDGDKWNNTTVNGSGNLTNLLDSTGAVTAATVDWTAQNTWSSGSTGATATSENGDLTKGYLDDSGAGWTVDLVSHYLLSDIYIIHGTDQGNPANMSAVSVNGHFYKGNGSTTVQATGINDSWSANNWSVADILLESNNYLKVSNQTAASLAGFSASPGRSAIAGIQVENTYSGTLNYWDINGATTGSGGTAPSGTWDSATNNWSASADGDVATGAWTSGNGAVFSAGTDATDPYTITVSGAQTASALWFKDGTVTIGGDGITLNGQAIVRNDGNATVNSVISGSDGLFKVGSGKLSLGAQSNFSGGTIVNEGTLSLTGGGGFSGTIRGSVDVNAGATLELATGDATGYGANGTQLTSINLNGGILHNAVTNNQTLGNGVINLTGGSVTGIAGSNLDFFQGSSAINSLASDTTSTITGTNLSIRQNGGLTINVEDGGAATDLDIASLIQSKAPAGQPLTKTGAGTLRFSGTGKTYNTATNVNEGTLLVNSLLRNTSEVNVAAGATAEFGATNIFVGGHGTELPASRVLTADGGTILMNTAFDSRFGNVTLSNGGTLTSNRALTAWDGLMGQTTGGVAAVLTVNGTGAATMNGTGGIHLNHVATFDIADTTGDASSDLVVSMTLANGGNAGGTGGINKTGLGTMEINGSQTYTGATNVTAGELSVLGALGVTAVTVQSGATLSGNGTIGGSVNFDTASKLDVTNGVLTVAGNVSFDGFGFSDVIGFDPYTSPNGTYVLIEGTDFNFANVANFGETNALDLGSGRSAWFDEGSFVAIVVPEPGSSALLLLSSLALLRRRRS